MTHIAIQEALDGKVVDWLELVSDEQYRKALRRNYLYNSDLVLEADSAIPWGCKTT